MVTPVPSLLPKTVTPQMQALEQAMVAPLASLPVETLTDLWDPARCPEWFLPHLAQAVRVVLWSSDWPEATKRRMIADSWQINALRGKVSGIELALSAMGWPGRVTEWHEQQPETRRGTFAVRVNAPAVGFTSEDLADLHAVIGITKRKSQHLETLTLPEISPAAPLHTGISVRMVHHHAAGMALVPSAADPAATPDICAGVLTVSRMTL
ncbi:phage tail protein I [Novispirillum itersonii]|uniref:phage tail protein I n=1 Tax=Novispirillum itersonii TaxID=189 RepID=UPI00039FBB23|nr:phage tail protein I [Novispirillum itersonii]